MGLTTISALDPLRTFASRHLSASVRAQTFGRLWLQGRQFLALHSGDRSVRFPPARTFFTRPLSIPLGDCDPLLPVRASGEAPSFAAVMPSRKSGLTRGRFPSLFKFE